MTTINQTSPLLGPDPSGQSQKSPKRKHFLVFCFIFIVFVMYFYKSHQSNNYNMPKSQEYENEIVELKKLPDLKHTDQNLLSGISNRVERDIFLFDNLHGCPFPSHDWCPAPGPLPKEEIELRKQQAIRDTELSKFPNDIRFIGYINNGNNNIYACFMINNIPNSFRLGETCFGSWRLTRINDSIVEFHNIKFPEMLRIFRAIDFGAPAELSTRVEF